MSRASGAVTLTEPGALDARTLREAVTEVDRRWPLRPGTDELYFKRRKLQENRDGVAHELEQSRDRAAAAERRLETVDGQLAALEGELAEGRPVIIKSMLTQAETCQHFGQWYMDREYGTTFCRECHAQIPDWVMSVVGMERRKALHLRAEIARIARATGLSEDSDVTTICLAVAKLAAGGPS